MFRGDPEHTGVTTEKLFAGQGGIRWRVQTGDVVRSSTAVTANRVFVGSGDGFLYAIDRESGTVVWKFSAGAPVHASPAVAGGLVVCATLAGRIFAVDEESGHSRWAIQTGPKLPLEDERSDWDMLVSSPVVVGGTVVIGGQDGLVYALDLRNGHILWRAKTKGRVRGTPAVSGDMVVVGSFDARVYAYDLKTGAERWVHRTVGDTLVSAQWGFDRRAVQSSPAVMDGMVFIGSRDSGLYGIDASTGERRWRFSHRGSWVLGSPSVRDGVVYVGSSDGHFIQAVEAKSGKELWRRATGGNVLGSPLVAGDLLLAGSREEGGGGFLFVLDLATGDVRWKLRLDEATVSTPTLYKGVVYIGTDAGSVLAIGQVNPAVAHLAVFYDSTIAQRSFVPGALLAREYFVRLGYQELGPDSLAAFMAARIADGDPSVVVFAASGLPTSVAPVPDDTVLFRRYLESGGKVVWLGGPVGTYILDSLGRPIKEDTTRMTRLIGVSFSQGDFSDNPAHPTDAGRAWGIENWMRGSSALPPSAVTEALTIDEVGKASAWVRSYRADRPGAGFVSLWCMGASVERLPVIRAVAEYGLLRPALPATASSQKGKGAVRVTNPND